MARRTANGQQKKTNEKESVKSTEKNVFAESIIRLKTGFLMVIDFSLMNLKKTLKNRGNKEHNR